MSKELSKIDKLANLDELHFILMEACQGIQPVQKNDLASLCENKSLNLMLSFESTLQFLRVLSVIDFQTDGVIAKSKIIAWENVRSHQELAALILDRIIDYLEKTKQIQTVFGEKVMASEQPDNSIVLYSNQMPLSFSCIKIFLFHAEIVIIDRDLPNRLVVDKKYEQYFRPLLELKLTAPEPEAIMSTPDVIPNEASPVRGYNVFISYSFKDEEYKRGLTSHFRGLIGTRAIKAWDGRAILPGEDWDQEIKKKLEEADVILFLISADFMDSDYINDVEIKNAIDRRDKQQVKIIPVIVRPCDFDNHPLNKYLAVPTHRKAISQWANKDEAYLDIVTHIKRILKVT